MPAPVATWPHALVLLMGIAGTHAQALAQTQITSNRTDAINVNGSSIEVAANVKLSVANWVNDPRDLHDYAVQTPVVTVGNNGSFSMGKGSQITAAGNRATNGISLQSGKVKLDGAGVNANRKDGNALQVEGKSTVTLTDSILKAEGSNAHALLLKNNDSIVTINGGSVTSEKDKAINILEGNSTMTLRDVDVSGTYGIAVMGGTTGTKTIDIESSTLTATNGWALRLEGGKTIVNAEDTKFISTNGRNSALRAEGDGNVVHVKNSEMKTRGEQSNDWRAGLWIADDASAEVSNSRIVTTGIQAYGVFASGGTVTLNDVDISTSGFETLHGLATDLKNGRAIVSGAKIKTEGTNSNGVHATGGSTATVARSDIIVAGDKSSGVYVGANSSVEIRDSAVDMDSALSSSAALTTNGSKATLTANNVKVAAAGRGVGLSSSGAGIVEFSGGSIRTAEGAGVDVSNGADVTIDNGADIRTKGAGAHALQISGGARNTVTVDAATLVTGNAEADLIHVNGSSADVIVRNGTLINTEGNIFHLQSNGNRASNATLNVDAVEMTGNILADGASTGAVHLRNRSALTGRINAASLSVDGSSTWNVSGNSDLTSLAINGGAVNYRQPDDGEFTIVKTGSLQGSGGRILMHAPLGDGTEPADFLHVTGDSTGKNVLAVHNTDGVGAQTVGDGIHLVQIDGRSAADNFVLEGGIMQAGLYEYFLKQGGQSRDNDWFLKSTRRAAVPGYLMTPTLNREFGYGAIGTLHERAGDIGNIARSEKAEASRDGVWGRIGGSHIRTGSSEQIEASARSSFMQFGKDWTIASDADGASTHAGATATLGEMRAGFTDDKRVAAGSPLGRDTGTANTRAVGLGAYWTKYQADGTYLDAVGQVTRYGTRYKDARAIEASNKGVGAALSIEAGKPIASYGSLRIEAQGQLIYQYLRMDKFSDELSDIDANGSSALRGRLGVRVSREMENGDTPRAAAPYATFNVFRNLSGAASLAVDGQPMNTQTNKTWGEIGVGISGRPSKQGMLYAGLKYRHQLGGLQFEGTSGELGYRYSW